MFYPINSGSFFGKIATYLFVGVGPMLLFYGSNAIGQTNVVSPEDFNAASTYSSTVDDSGFVQAMIDSVLGGPPSGANSAARYPVKTIVLRRQYLIKKQIKLWSVSGLTNNGIRAQHGLYD
jgi:hypothetical protein